MKLPDYAPPNRLHTNVAVALAPLLVLLAFTAVVLRWMDVDTALFLLAGSALWVGLEMNGWQRAQDAYNADYVRRHLGWRSPVMLDVLLDSPHTTPETRRFVQAWLDAGCELRPDGPAMG